MATVNGGGLEANTSVSLLNCTVTRNRTDSDDNFSGIGGGIYNSGSATLKNSIVAGNFQGSGTAASDLAGTFSGDHNLIGDAATAGGLSHNVDGNIVGSNGAGTLPIESVLDTELRDHGGLTETHGLITNSPAVNAGSNSAVMDASLSTDQRGNGFVRVADGTVDIGALEIQTLNLIVDTLTDESDQDFSTGDLSLREAIEQANANPGMDTILFDIGSNNPEIDLLPALGELEITDDVLIDGINTNITGGQVTIDGQQSVRPIHVSSTNAIVNLSHLTIKNGWSSDDGAGILNEGGTLTVNSLSFTGNISQGDGGALSSEYGTLTVFDSAFTNNSAEGQGGGIRATNNTTTVTGSVFYGNVSESEGGGIYSHAGQLTLSESAVSGNHAAVKGGGIGGTAAISIIGTTISDNTAQSGGGIGLYGTVASKLILNSTISGNSASEHGGGLEVNTDVSLINCTITGNRADSDGNNSGDGGGIRNDDGVLTLGNTIVAGNYQGLEDTPNDLDGVVTGGASLVNNLPEYAAGDNYFIDELPQIAIGDHNLIGDAGSAGGLIDGIDGNIVGNHGTGTLEITSILNPILLDNGGITQTHELVRNSPAIDAAFNQTAVNSGLTEDQRGVARIQDGDHNSTSTLDIGAFEFFAVSSQYDLRIVKSETETAANGELNSLPENLDWIGEWDDYWVEIWLSTPSTSDLGILSGAFNLNYNTDVTSATGMEFGPAFTESQSGNINDMTGAVENLSAETTLNDVGDDQYVLFARIHFESTTEDSLDLDLDGHSLNPQSPGLSIQNPTVILTSDETSDVVGGLAPDTQIWANPYDYNDDDSINFRDLIWFVSAYKEIPSQSTSTYAWIADINRSDQVDFRDLIWFVSNYGNSKQGNSDVIYPQGFPEDWNQLLLVESQAEVSTNAQPVTQPVAEEMLGRIQQQALPGLSSNERDLIDHVSIQVVDLEGNTLGRAAPGIIYLDTNAAGHGWFVDPTPAEHSEYTWSSELSLIALPESDAAGLVDLRTVILHELGHLIGYQHGEEGVMQESLVPGERKLAGWESDDDLFYKSPSADVDLFFATVKAQTDLQLF